MQIGWIFEPLVSHYDVLLFYNVMDKHQDHYFYRPIAVARREEYGWKYRFMCIAMPRQNPGVISHFADIEIYTPYKGLPYASYLCRIDFDQLISQRFPWLK